MFKWTNFVLESDIIVSPDPSRPSFYFWQFKSNSLYHARYLITFNCIPNYNNVTREYSVNRIDFFLVILSYTENNTNLTDDQLVTKKCGC